MLLCRTVESETMNINYNNKYIVSVNSKSYEVILRSETDDGGYWIECPALPGCDSQGDTLEEALEMIKDAIKGHLEVAGK